VPTLGAGEITADTAQVVINLSGYLPGSYFYAATKDVTELIRTFSSQEPAGNYPGNATYTTGGVDATWNAESEIAYAGWSLIIIYSSAETQGHQLYLFDTFFSSGQYNNVDFDFDGNPGGTISGFLVPEPVAGEVNAAKITAFVGEGDNWYSGDFISINAPDNSPPTGIPDSYKLDDGTGFGVNNVWNGYSVGFAAEGVDVDTFYVTWASGLLSPGDTQAQVDIYTDIDIWELVYIILSFRSDTSVGGTISYLIK